MEDDRSCTVSTTSTEPVHIPSQSSIRCGGRGHPWQLEAPAGQRIVVSVLDFAATLTTTDHPADRRCRGRTYGFLVDETKKANVSVCEATSADALSGSTQEDAELYPNIRRRAAVTTSSNSVELHFAGNEHLGDNFLIRVEGQLTFITVIIKLSIWPTEGCSSWWTVCG